MIASLNKRIPNVLKLMFRFPVVYIKHGFDAYWQEYSHDAGARPLDDRYGFLQSEPPLEFMGETRYSLTFKLDDGSLLDVPMIPERFIQPVSWFNPYRLRATFPRFLKR